LGRLLAVLAGGFSLIGPLHRLCLSLKGPGMFSTQSTSSPRAASAESHFNQQPYVNRKATLVKRLLHVGIWPVKWKEQWVGPANMDRANLRINGMDTYALVAAVLLQVILGLYAAVPEPAADDPRIKYYLLQRASFELQMFFLMAATICSTYTMVTFLICKIYAVMALGSYKDVAYETFQFETRSYRIKGFWCLVYSLVFLLIAFSMNLYTRIKGHRGLIMAAVTMIVLAPMLEDWRHILDAAELHVEGF